jgi:aldehyde dehydrogenase (NAD+)
VIVREDLFVGGQWVRSRSGYWLDVVSPIDEELLGRVPLPSFREVGNAVRAAREAFDSGPWPRFSVERRADFLRTAMRVFEKKWLDIAIKQQTDETGVPESFTHAATTAMSPFLEQVVHDAAEVIFTETHRGVSGPVRVFREPFGVAAGVISWNVPLMAAVTKLFPSLLMGCSMVLKTASQSPLSSYLLAEALAEAELPPGVVSILPGGRDVLADLISHPQIDTVAFTGRIKTSREIAAVCGHHGKPIACELVGKSVAVLTPDLDLPTHLPALVAHSLPGGGQTGVATSRLLVHSSQVDELRDALIDVLSVMKVGNPHDPDTAFGPLVSEKQRDRVEGYIASGKAQGAAVAYGGTRPAQLSTGFYLSPTVLEGVTNDMAVARDEIFGPVLCILSYETETEAIRLADDLDSGLGTSVYANDPEHALRLATQLRTRICAINDAPLAGVGGPFGGYENSGAGGGRGPQTLLGYLGLKSIALSADWSPRSA